MKRMIALLLLAALLLSALPVLADTPALTRYTLGSKMDDFTVTTFDGRSVTLSEVLKQKDMVLINIWASWCGPCGMEFPHMQQAYQAYGDRVEIIAVSTEPADTDDVLRDYAQQKGLTFPVARDTANLGLRFAASSIPMSIVVDRFGVVSCIISGAQTSADAFTRLFDAYVGEDYPETVLLNSIPGKRPDVPAAAPERLMEALGVPGDPISFDTPAGVYVWPMIPAEEDGRLCVMPTNGGVNESRSALKCLVQAESGDALAITMKTSTEAAIDLVTITVDGKMVKAFGGESIFFLMEAEWFRPLYLISGIWAGIGWGTIIYLAAIAGVDPGLYEAARLDGAGRWRQMWNITLPSIAPTVSTMLIMKVGAVFGASMEKVLLMQQPATYETSQVLETYVYQVGITSGQYSTSIAIGLFSNLVNLILLLSSNWVSKKLTDYGIF